MHTIEIACGPDELSNRGSTWYLLRDGEPYDCGGTNGMPRATPGAELAQSDWLRWLKRQLRGHRISWAKCDVEPLGWSLGSGHAPQGIRVRAVMR